MRFVRVRIQVVLQVKFHVVQSLSPWMEKNFFRRFCLVMVPISLKIFQERINSPGQFVSLTIMRRLRSQLQIMFQSMFRMTVFQDRVVLWGRGQEGLVGGNGGEGGGKGKEM